MKNDGLGGIEPRPASSHRPPLQFKSTAAAPLASIATTPNIVAMDKKDGAARAVTQWNTKNLGLRLGADLLSAAAAATMVAPIISIIDRSIMENASGRRSLGQSLRSSLRTLILQPHRLVLSRPFALIFLLYGGTYATANWLDTATSTVQNRAAAHVTSGTAKFAASSAANISLCIYKDQAFARLFGPPGAAPRPVAMPSYLLFAARDCMTIFASFNVPSLLGPALTRRLGDEVQRYASGQTIAQFAAPAVVQLVSTPVHLLGLDIYNRPYSSAGGLPTLRDRWVAVRRNWAISTAARVCRIIPAFGVGGVVNFKVRQGLMERLS
ncbi:hypothetical protein B0T26DRAFT_660232 [Lasiosphaeria miniovina]|uniref:Sequence orphan n=1 Tax=Lasiosphaeria miniovina TaxID=1954250 RepID=A0AA40DGC2_9PEZI|nr:uncharacterized protein B0T26DRAFT_660232 [Lasiosphaeria miniovina]KAK0702050.1 hypothetical protein B0T26DRAFT_660232 [Lasiosphaeria miniovina]